MDGRDGSGLKIRSAQGDGFPRQGLADVGVASLIPSQKLLACENKGRGGYLAVKRPQTQLDKTTNRHHLQAGRLTSIRTAIRILFPCCIRGSGTKLMWGGGADDHLQRPM
ncbi:uncharacterized protein TRIREDRAFT_107685 [Trichoderma reesei QM6a]|uniref:Predicted protein n=1 Tax=Hypocrea jecorina (strain QM6a) TaxID=431241 RepID=G0RKS1_HYPJQ|nr:uncharacterized protein TRIREDRAFT_107685 [Trichoderma reesei QM6a]EGR48370.1 predicted protein [Trichoderma reesei QM6a]